jgi:hypothetical protein
MPDETVDRSDPGDDVLRRFRYQAGRAALLALLTLDDTSGVVEVFCEHHEDVLLRRVDGRFDAEQVKTRADGTSPFKSGDEPFGCRELDHRWDVHSRSVVLRALAHRVLPP